MTNTECLERAISLAREHGCGPSLDRGLLPTHYKMIDGLECASVHTRSYGTDLYTHTSSRDVLVAEMKDLKATELSDYNLQQNMFGLLSFMCGQLGRSHQARQDQVLYWFMIPSRTEFDGWCETVSVGPVSVDILCDHARALSSLRMRYGFLHLVAHETVIPWPRLHAD